MLFCGAVIELAIAAAIGAAGTVEGLLVTINLAWL